MRLPRRPPGGSPDAPRAGAPAPDTGAPARHEGPRRAARTHRRGAHAGPRAAEERPAAHERPAHQQSAQDRPARERSAPRDTAPAGTAPPPRPVRAAAPRAPRPLLRSLRPRSVRAKTVALLMVPVVSLMALWAFATVSTAQDVWDLLRLKEVHRTLLDPVEDTVTALQAERAAAGRYLAAPTPAARAVLRGRAAATDRAAAPLDLGRDYTSADAAGLGADAGARVSALVTRLRGLAAVRRGVESRRLDWPAAYRAYGDAVDGAFAVTGSLTGLQDHDAASDARVLLEFSRGREMLAREDALLGAAHTSGRLPAAEQREFTGAAHTRRDLYLQSAADLRPADRSAWQAVADSAEWKALASLEDAVAAAPAGRAAAGAAPAARWDAAAGTAARTVRAVEEQAGRAAAGRADPYVMGVFTRSGAAVALGLVAVLASLLISVQVGRALVGELVGLRNSALDLAGRRLPAAMRRLLAGEEIDVEAEAPLSAGRGDDEIAQVAGALETVHRAALKAAVERAEVLSGVSGVFVNLARRSQVLVHRQLTLLDAMERRTEDPAELADLFRLDHLTTRMRRHAEGLIILSGAAPGRAWRKPVPMLDVVRAAVSEVEDYARVEVHRMPHAAVAGSAVADLTHLVAELVENATAFSPPHTRVHVRGEQVGNGYVLEVEDRGLGMGAEAMADANRRIAAAEQLDLFDSDRLGLYVVSRLARRHQVKVSLRPSAYGGTTAVVLLPTALLEQAAAGPARSGGARPGVRPAPGGAVRPAGPGAAPAGPVPVPSAPPGPVRPAVPGPAGPAAHERPAHERPAHGQTPDAAPAHGEPAHGPAAHGEPVPQPAAPGAAGPGPLPSGPPPSGPAPSGPHGPHAPGQPLPLRPAAAAPRPAAGDSGRTPPPRRPAQGPRPLPRQTGVLRPFGADGRSPGVLRPVPFRAADGGPPGSPAAPAGPPDATPGGIPAGTPGAAPAATAPATAAATPGGAPAAGASTGLPRRVRQASIAPQLREAPAPVAGRRPAPAGRTPEQARAAMSAFQSGWARGTGRPSPARRSAPDRPYEGDAG
ncbi:nitrate- and nitrite sensing domain-containing protein [Streptacidiphilus sp. ASG 303]|uniref:nitrate- and nitrite sensing domain-containing protein n=1 Tax=Streptacidiphilus sp. ASG 303 TaxID=2896847 RepID=UPI00272AA148